MNFALMFALALGIDYALFIVYRFRGAFFGDRSRPGRRGRRDDGHRRQGRAVQRPDRADLALGGDARAEPGLPVDGARDHVRGDLRARRVADAAAGRARQARPEGRRSSACPGCTPASTARPASRRWGERLWRRPLLYGDAGPAGAGAAGAADPAARHGHAVDQGRPPGRLLARRLRADPAAFGAGRARHPAARRPRGRGRGRRRPAPSADSGRRCRAARDQGPAGRRMVQVVPSSATRRRAATGATIDRLRGGAARPRSWSAAPSPRTTTSSSC